MPVRNLRPDRHSVYLIESTSLDPQQCFTMPDLEMMRLRLLATADYCSVEVVAYALLAFRFEMLVRVPPKSAANRLSNAEILRRANSYFDRRVTGRLGLAYQSRSSVVKAAALREVNRLRGLTCDVSHFMKLFKQNYSIWYNRSRHRTGTVWRDRYRSSLLDDEPEMIAAAAASVNLLPVLHGLAERPEHYRFCSVGANGDTH